jgi:hypothetical protein
MCLPLIVPQALEAIKAAIEAALGFVLPSCDDFSKFLQF